MSIINFQYAGPGQLDYDNDEYTYSTNPVWDTNITSDSSIYSESFYYRKYVGGYEKSNIFSSRPVWGEISTPPEELWVRLVFKDRDNYVSGAGIQYLRLFENIDGVNKLRASLQLGVSGTASTNLYWLTYNSVGTVVTTNLIGAITSTFKDISTNDYILDFRIKLHPIAGFIQLYDYTTTLKYEILGRTFENGLTYNKYALDISTIYNSNSYTYRGIPLFAILADEKTFGMYVSPLLVKGEGSLQDQDVGSSYANLVGRKRLPTDNGFLRVTTSSNQTKSYTCKLQNAADVAIPSNYVIKSIKFTEIFEADQVVPAPINISLTLKMGEGFVYNTPLTPIIPNTDNNVDQRWQVRNVKMDVSPKSGNSWQFSDLEELEVGFSVTGV